LIEKAAPGQYSRAADSYLHQDLHEMKPDTPDQRAPCRTASPTGPAGADEYVVSGQVIDSIHRRHRASEFRKFLGKLDKQVPADLDVHLICDNYSTHTSPVIIRWLQAHPRFHVDFTPTYSWLNQVERWFGLLTDQKLRRGTHTSLQALEKDIRDWIRTWNENPRPFTWTKTADEILERLASYLQRIPGAGH
jgi:transposase